MENLAGTPIAETPAAEPASVAFTGRRWALFKVILKNVLLNVVTLGIYRFWGKTRVRRYFWSNVVVGGEPLEYTGRGMEMFIGFLIVLAVLIPLSLLQTGIAFLIGPESFLAEGALNLSYFLLFLFLVQFALFRMWRYRLTRTRWRGIRFRLEGAALRYAGRAFLWFVAQGVTLGIATPWARVDLMRYKLRRVNYGDTAFGFEGRGRDLLVPWLITWVPPALLVGAALALTGSEGLAFFDAMSEGRTPPPSAFPVALAFAPLAVPLFILLFIWYRIREFRYMVGCIGFGDAELRSSVRFWGVFPWLLLVAAIFVGLLLVFSIVVPLAVAAAVDTNGSPGQFFIIGQFIGFAMLIFFLLFMPLITYPIAVFSIVRHLWTTLTIGNPEAFDRAVQATEEAPKFGEGLADAFDVGAF